LDRLTGAQSRFLAALLFARSVREAAEKANVAERTAWRWMNEPAVRRAWAEMQSLMLQNAVQRVVSVVDKAMSTLEHVMDGERYSPASRVSAARVVIGLAARLADGADFGSASEQFNRQQELEFWENVRRVAEELAQEER